MEKKGKGKRQMMLGVSPEQHEQIQQAAEREMRPMTQFVLYYSVQAAERVIREHELRNQGAQE